MPTVFADKTELHLDEAIENRRVIYSPRPISFDKYAEFWPREGNGYELIDGVLVERMAAQLDHEKLFAWLFTLLNLYCQANRSGTILGSRTPVRIHQFRGRMPDLLFVRKAREDILEQGTLHEAPDLIFEFASPNDRPSDFIAQETDYCSIGVSEIVFVDMPRRAIRILRRQADGDYSEEKRTVGESVRLESTGGVTPKTDWLLTEPRPDFIETLGKIVPQ